VEDSNSRDSCNSIAAELGKLITAAAVDINETIHVSNAEALDRGLRIQLPLRTQTREKD
jgi:hypothetical protein